MNNRKLRFLNTFLDNSIFHLDFQKLRMKAFKLLIIGINLIPLDLV
mgnify:CR=1 FL=1